MDEEVTRITLTLAIAISRFVLILFEDRTEHCFDCDSKKKSATFPRVLILFGHTISHPSRSVLADSASATSPYCREVCKSCCWKAAAAGLMLRTMGETGTDAAAAAAAERMRVACWREAAAATWAPLEGEAAAAAAAA